MISCRRGAHAAKRGAGAGRTRSGCSMEVPFSRRGELRWRLARPLPRRTWRHLPFLERRVNQELVTGAVFALLYVCLSASQLPCFADKETELKRELRTCSRPHGQHPGELAPQSTTRRWCFYLPGASPSVEWLEDSRSHIDVTLGP